MTGPDTDSLHRDADREVVRRWCEARGLAPGLVSREVLEVVYNVFVTTVPYENCTKILAADRRWREAGTLHDPDADAGNVPRRMPATVLDGNLEAGTGGTCWSLAQALWLVLDWLTFPCHRVTGSVAAPADHGAVVATVGEERFLCDPGYSVVRPVPVGRVQPEEVDLFHGTAWMEAEGGGRHALHTRAPHDGTERRRLEIFNRAAGDAAFTAAWDASFRGPLMERINVVRPRGDDLHRLWGAERWTYTPDGPVEEELAPDDVPAAAADIGGFDAGIARDAAATLDGWRAEGGGPFAGD